jgi:serine/threonine protein kinase
LGAIRWRAPEFIATKKASFEADVYSLGMCIVEAVTGKLPWGTVPDSAVKWHLNNKTFLKQPKRMSDDEWALVCAMCDFDPSKRMTLAEVEKRVFKFSEMEAEAASVEAAQAAT